MQQTKQELTRQVLLIFIVLIIVLVIIQNVTAIFSLAYGTLMGLLNFYLLAATIKKAVQLNAPRARIYATAHYLLRYILLFFVILIALVRPDIDFIWALIGLLIPKTAILGGNIYSYLRAR